MAGEGVSGPIAAVLATMPLFAGLAPAELDDLARRAVTRRYGRGETIFSQGDDGTGLFLIVQGQAEIVRENLDGNELILTVLGRPEHFGELALLDAAPRTASARSLDASVTVFLSREAFRDFLATHPAAVYTCLEVMARQFRRLTEVADELALQDVPTRLVHMLLRLTEPGSAAAGRPGGDVPAAGQPAGGSPLADQSRAGILAPRGKAERPIRRDQDRAEVRVTQQQLAGMIGVTRESVNKHLSALVSAGLIELRRGQILVPDRRALQELIDSGP
jgi:CRP-like cAMP-binding protein